VGQEALNCGHESAGIAAAGINTLVCYKGLYSGPFGHYKTLNTLSMATSTKGGEGGHPKVHFGFFVIVWI